MIRSVSARIALFVVVAAILVAIGHSFVLQRVPDATTEYLTIRGDTLHYVSMIERGLDSAPVPFKHRILIPLLAQLIPLSPIDSLRLISYLSLFALYVVVLATSTRLGISAPASIAGLAIVYSSTWHLYSGYHNPFLTDAPALLLLALAIRLLLDNRLALFCLVSVLGVLSRESGERTPFAPQPRCSRVARAASSPRCSLPRQASRR